MNKIPDLSGAPGAKRVTASQAPAVAAVSPPVMAKSVIVVEDDNGLREQLVKILNSAPGIRCVGACPSAEDALRLIPARKPDVVLMDIRLPAMSGIDCVAALKQILSTTGRFPQRRACRARRNGSMRVAPARRTLFSPGMIQLV